MWTLVHPLLRKSAILQVSCTTKRRGLRNTERTDLHFVLMNKNRSIGAWDETVASLLLSLVLSPVVGLLHCCVIFKLGWTVCIVGLPVFCEQCHVRLPASCRWCLICVTVFCGWCRLWEPVLCKRCLIGFCAFWGWCLVVLPACGWCRGGMFGKVEAVTLGCLANFWLHRLGDVIVVPEPGWGSQSSLEESTSHMSIQTRKKHTHRANIPTDTESSHYRRYCWLEPFQN